MLEPYELFCPTPGSVGAGYGPVTATRAQLFRWMWVVKKWQFDLTLAWDDIDSDTGLPVSRFVHNEFDMDDGSQAGASTDEPSVPGYINEEYKSCPSPTIRNWTNPPTFDYNQVSMAIGPGGTEAIGVADGSLNIAMAVYKNLGSFCLFPLPTDVGYAELPFATFDFDGITLPLFTLGSSPRLLAVGGGSLTPVEFWEHRQADASNPIWDGATGGVILTPADAAFYNYP